MTQSTYELQGLSKIRADIARLEKRATKLADLDNSVKAVLSSSEALIGKIEYLAQEEDDEYLGLEELDKVKDSLIKLFQRGGNPDDDGNQPISPEPNNDGGLIEQYKEIFNDDDDNSENQPHPDSQSNSGSGDGGLIIPQKLAESEYSEYLSIGRDVVASRSWDPKLKKEYWDDRMIPMFEKKVREAEQVSGPESNPSAGWASTLIEQDNVLAEQVSSPETQPNPEPQPDTEGEGEDDIEDPQGGGNVLVDPVAGPESHASDGGNPTTVTTPELEEIRTAKEMLDLLSKRENVLNWLKFAPVPLIQEIKKILKKHLGGKEYTKFVESHSKEDLNNYYDEIIPIFEERLKELELELREPAVEATSESSENPPEDEGSQGGGNVPVDPQPNNDDGGGDAQVAEDSEVASENPPEDIEGSQGGVEENSTTSSGSGLLANMLKICQTPEEILFVSNEVYPNPEWKVPAFQMLPPDQQERIRKIFQQATKDVRRNKSGEAWLNDNLLNYEWLDPESSDYQEQCSAISSAPIIALDIETYQPTKPKKNSKPKAFHPWESRIRLIQLCIGDRTFLINLGDRDMNYEESLIRHQPTIDLLRRIIQNPDQKIVGHNIHFDLRFLAAQFEIRNAKNVACTMIGTQVYYGDYGSQEGEKKGKHVAILPGGYSLANVAERLLGVKLDKTEQTSDFGGDLTEEQITYAALDPRVSLRVYEALKDLYNDESKPLYRPNLIDKWQFECDVISGAIEIEMVGMPLDIEAAEQQLATIEAHKEKLIKEWEKLCPDLKYTQRDKLIDHLNKNYNLNVENLRKGGLDKKTRENELIQIKLKLQGLSAQANNLKGFLESAKRDGRVHTIYKTLTGFGRFSSGGGTSDLPNLQSIKAKPNPILDEFKLPNVRAVIKPKPGITMAVMDLAGAHGRIAASETQDPTAIAGNNDDTIDNHSKVAVFIAKALGLDWSWERIAELCKQNTEDGIKAKLLRATAKNTYYGWLNGAGWQRIQEQISGNIGRTPSEKECRAAIKGCEALYPGVLKHRSKLMARLRQTAITLEDGRRIVINETSDGFRFCMPMQLSKFNQNKWEPPYTQSLACIWSRIEATAVKKALIQIMEVREKHPEWKLEVINYVHDEIDIEVKTEFADVAIPLVNDIIGDSFASLLTGVNDGRETNWKRLVVKSWAEK